MKKVRAFSQRISIASLIVGFLFSFLASLLSGCGSKDISVESKSAYPFLDDGNINHSGFGDGLPQRSNTAEQIYFKRVLVDHGSIQKMTAVGYASPRSRTGVPFGFHAQWSDLTTTSPVTEYKPPTTPAFDISKYDDHTLIYWVRQINGEEVRMMDLTTKREITLAKLSIPIGIGNGIVCPVKWENSLFYGNSVNGVFVIERIDFGLEHKQRRSVFVAPPAADEGFICPLVYPKVTAAERSGHT